MQAQTWTVCCSSTRNTTNHTRAGPTATLWRWNTWRLLNNFNLLGLWQLKRLLLFDILCTVWEAFSLFVLCFDTGYLLLGCSSAQFLAPITSSSDVVTVHKFLFTVSFGRFWAKNAVLDLILVVPNTLGRKVTNCKPIWSSRYKNQCYIYLLYELYISTSN